MRISGNLVFPEGIRRGTIQFSERIERIEEEGPADVTFEDGLIGPGFIDIHFHGGIGEDFNGCENGGIERILDYCVRHGTTSCLAGITTDTVEATDTAVEKIAAYIRSGKNRTGRRTELLGIHLEGPFLNPAACGAMPKSLIRSPDLALFKKWESSGVLRMITLAPEMPGCDALITYIRERGTCVLSAGHTKADYGEMLEAITRGVGHITHFYNAITGLHHRNPGAAAAGLFSDVTLELITDDIHVHPVMCELVYRMKKTDRICLITDGVAAGGLPDGAYSVNGRNVHIKQGRIVTDNGVLAGSAHTMDRAVKSAARFVPVQDAWMMASRTPARELGLLKERGELKVGNIADFAVLNSDLTPRAAFVRGKLSWCGNGGAL